MINAPNFRAQCAELLAAIQLYTGLNPAASEMSSVEITEKLMDAMAATVAALATPPPLAPNYIDPEHHGEDRELLQVFYAACNAEGGTADEIHLRGIKAVMAAPAALATPPPEPPTDDEVHEWVNATLGAEVGDLQEFGWGWHCFTKKQFACAIRAALKRWGK